MVLEDNDKKSETVGDSNIENNNKNSYSEEVYLGAFEEIDLDLLKNEMKTIEDALSNNSLNLSKDEKINLQKDLKLISDIVFKKSQSDIS